MFVDKEVKNRRQVENHITIFKYTKVTYTQCYMSKLSNNKKQENRRQVCLSG